MADSRPNDAMSGIRNAMEAAVEPIFKRDPEALADRIEERLQRKFDAVVPEPPESFDADEYGRKHSSIASLRGDRQSSVEGARYGYAKARQEALERYEAARDDWKRAVEAFDNAMTEVEIDFRHSIDVASNSYENRLDSDSKLLAMALFSEPRVAAVEAVQVAEANAAGSAGTALAAAAGAFMAGYADFVTALATARTKWMVAREEIDRTFWSEAETVLDQT